MLEEEYQPRRELPRHLRKTEPAEAPFEYSIRDAVPAARVIYIEPDVWIDPNAQSPATDTIVIKGLE